MARSVTGRGEPGVTVAARTAPRLAAAERWLLGRPAATELLVVAASLEAGRELLLRAARRAGAAFGWRRTTLGLLAAELSAAGRPEEESVPLSPTAQVALAARVAHELRGSGRLGRYEPVADTPGFVRSLAATASELRMAGLGPAEVAPVSPELAAVLEEMERRLAAEGLADRALVFARATEVARAGDALLPPLDLPTLFLDVPLRSRLEAELAAAVLRRAPKGLVTVPRGDEATLAALRALSEREGWEMEAVEGEAMEPGAAGRAERGRDDAGEAASEGEEGRALARLQTHLFAEDPRDGPNTAGPRAGESGTDDRDDTPGASDPRAGEPGTDDRHDTSRGDQRDDSLRLFSAPGENRECVEIARHILSRAEAGVSFDRMAIFLRSPEVYAAHLEEALGRAGIPAHFERGVVRPDPGGRAFLALLRCRAEEYSARRFAEYLSLGQAPEATTAGEPPEAPTAGERWQPPEEEGREPRSVPPGAALDAGSVAGEQAAGGAVVAGTLRAPRRWERLIVEAAVVGGLERWRRRLDGLAGELRLELEGARREHEEADAPAVAAIERKLEELAHLRAFALPLLEELAALPVSAPWAVWLEGLSALAARSLRRPERVLALLADLAPLGPVGPVGLDEVLRVLAPVLQELRLRPEERRFGKLFVAGTEEARGRSFEVVFLPGLAEGLFPGKIHEDPILLDRDRERLNASSVAARLPLNEERVGEERLALRRAAGAAASALVLSYPRMDSARARPRVPSFYALESLRAAEGRLPLFEELARRADAVTEARIGWPAPPRPEQAIDEAEYDLAVLEALHAEEPPEGAARYLLTANPHLARALRFRAYRWEVRKWSEADGLVDPPPAALEALAEHRLGVRPTSATALHAYAACPYRYFLSAVQRLEPREDPRPIETLDPLQRGSLVHDIQFAALASLREEGLLPVRPANLSEATERLDAAVGRVAEEYRDELAPAIERVWSDGIEAIRTDLRQWLRQLAADESGFVPWRFELAFGLPRREPQDPESRPEPVQLEGARVRGSIDLVERDGSGTLRVTDHKTGRARFKKGALVQGGEQVQPVLYSLVTERLFPGASVRSGRLHYCTSAGDFAAHEVPLDDRARAAMRRIFELVDADVERGFLPAYPREGACRFCDYLRVCGPAEELRTARKRDLAGVGGVRELREMP